MSDTIKNGSDNHQSADRGLGTRHGNLLGLSGCLLPSCQARAFLHISSDQVSTCCTPVFQGCVEARKSNVYSLSVDTYSGRSDNSPSPQSDKNGWM